MKKQLRAVEKVFTITILITFLVCPGLHAAEETLPTPEEIIAKNIEAIGGIKALKKIKNKKMVQIRKHVPTNTEYKDIIYTERPDKFYRIAGGGERNGSINGRFVWEVAGNHAMSQESYNPRALLFDGADGPDAHYKSMKTEGIEQINGKDCYKVVKTPEKNPQRTVYYDKNTYMIVKTILNLKGPNRSFKLEFYNEEYKKINGILFPYRRVEFQNGKKWNEITTEKIELNIEMPEGIFDIPEKVKAIMDKKGISY